MLLVLGFLVACQSDEPQAPRFGTHPGVSPAISITDAGVRVVKASDHITGQYPAHCARDGISELYPVPTCTPGSLRDDVDPNNLKATICKPYWSSMHHPPRAETERVKTQAMAAYGVPPEKRDITELDHFYPVSFGGSNDVSNLWAQVSTRNSFWNDKDDVEIAVHYAICSGKVNWVDAVHAFDSDWRTAKQKLGLVK